MNEFEHQGVREEIAGYAAGRLDEAAAERVRSHLDRCPDCAELARAARALAAGTADRPAELLEPHPEANSLVEFALGRSGDPGGRIERHLEVCESCRLEMSVWRQEGETPGFGLETRPAVLPAVLPAARRAATYRFAAAAAAAGILVGVGLSLTFRGGPGDVPGSAWSGAVPLVVLESSLRGETEIAEVPLAGGQPYVPLAAAPLVPAEAGDDTKVTFEVLRENRSVWSSELSASATREALDSAGVVTFLVPTGLLEDGEHTFRITAGGDGPPTELHFRIRRAP